MFYEFNSNYNIRLEFFGGLLTCPRLKKEYILNYSNSIFLYLISNKVSLDKIYKFLNENNYKDKIELDAFIKMGVLLKISKNILNNNIDIDFIDKLKRIKEKKYLSFPISTSLYLTYNCQLNCKFCYFKSKKMSVNKYDELNLEKWKKIILQLKDNNISYISLLGGEPTLYHDINRLVEFLNDEKIVTTITTNGKDISNSLKKIIINSEYITPSISLQSLDECSNKKLMGVTSKQAIEIIKYFRSFNKEIRINTVITNQTIDEIKNLVDFCVNNGIKDFFTNVYLDNNRSSNLKKYSFKEYRNIKEEILRYIYENKYNINFQLQGCLMFSAYSEKQFDLTSEYDFIRYGCEGGNTKLEIMPNGDVYPCASFSSEDFKYENCINKNIKDIWDNAEYLNALRNFKNRDKLCMKCNFYKFCNGGCPSENLRNYKSIEKRGDLRCSIIQEKA